VSILQSTYSNTISNHIILERDIVDETGCQWASLFGQSPSEFTSNSLEDVCSLVETMPYCFVTIQPNDAAHMPTWCSYVIQALLSLGEIVSLVLFLFVIWLITDEIVGEQSNTNKLQTRCSEHGNAHRHRTNWVFSCHDFSKQTVIHGIRCRLSALYSGLIG
jgi:hypothetical protein